VISLHNELTEKAFELGFTYEKEYRGCAQCTIAAVQDTLNVRNDFVFKSASGLSAGGGLLTVGHCGGYVGGILMMSSFFGRSRENFDNDRENKYCSFNMAVALHELFRKKYGSIICREIHECIFGRSFDMWDEDERNAFEDAGAHKDKCTGVVADASRWTTQLILEEMEKRGLTLKDFTHLTYPT
jgi:C_GCAxxG_C_C family probable redox protein